MVKLRGKLTKKTQKGENMRVIASDFDNTLYVKDDIEMKQNISSVKKFINSGNIFIIITGRSFSNIKKVLNELDIPYSYLICQDGANIFDKDDKCIKSTLLDKNKSIILEEYMKNNNLDYSFESAFNDNDIIDNAVKITVTLSGIEDAKKVLEKIKKETNVPFYGYVSTKHINIIDDYVNKSYALNYLKDNNYIANKIEVIGDDINDFEMLSNFEGVVMETHDQILDKLNKKSVSSVHSFIDENI